MKIHVISLQRTPERLVSFATRNSMPKLEIIKVDAVDGVLIDRVSLAQQGLLAPDLIFTGPAVGCALSHIACWRRAAEAGEPMTICEDDAILRRDFVPTQTKLMTTQTAFDLIYWNFNLDMHVEFLVPGLGICMSVFESNRIGDNALNEFQDSPAVPHLYRARRLWGTLCYTVSPQGARTLLSRILPLRNVASAFTLPSGVGSAHTYGYQAQGLDMIVGVAHLASLQGFVALPPLAISLNDKASSTIGGGHRDIRTAS